MLHLCTDSTKQALGNVITMTTGTQILPLLHPRHRIVTVLVIWIVIGILTLIVNHI